MCDFKRFYIRRIQASQEDFWELHYMLGTMGHATLVSEAQKQFIAGVRDFHKIEAIVGRLQRFVNGLDSTGGDDHV